MDVSEIKWLSIWCTRWTSYRGTIVIYDIYIIREIYIIWHICILMIIVSQISPISDSPSTWPRFFFLRIQRSEYELTTVATIWSCSCWLPTASCLTVATLYQLLNSYTTLQAVASSGKDTIISRKQVPRAMSLERFPKVYETDLHVLRFVFSNFKINFINRLTFCHRSDLVQILDQKTFYIPNFHLFVGGERGFRFQV